MSAKKTIVLIAGAILAIVLSAFTGVSALADTVTDTGADFNGQGVLVPSGYDPAAIDVTKVDPDSVAGAPFRFVSPLLDIQFMSGDTKLSVPGSLTYVYFNMNQIERKAWDSGRAGIYYQDPASRNWVACASTFSVTGANPPDGRLACVAPQSALYGLGIIEVPAVLEPGADVGPGVENASFFTDSSAQTGNQGIFIPNGLDLDRIALRLVDPKAELLPDMPFNVNRPIIRIDWIGDAYPLILNQVEGETPVSGATEEQTALQNLTYVFYVLDRASRQIWDDGSLSIYAYDETAGAWVVCPSVLTESGEYGTVSCVAGAFTYYALGIDSAEQ